MRSERFLIPVGSWSMMLARLLLAIASSDAETELSRDLARARRLATLVGADVDVIAALSRTLIQPPPGLDTLPHVEVALAEWESMRAQLILGVVECAGCPVDAYPVLGVPLRWLRCELRRARSRLRADADSDGTGSPR